MGQLYSHLVFRPPQICSYQSTNGQIKYVLPDDQGIPTVHSTDLIWLLNSMGFRIPCVFIRQPNSEYVAIYAHQNAEDLGSSVRDAHTLSHRLGIDVLAFEYSGYGLSERPPRSQYHSSRSVHGHAVAPSLLDSDRSRAMPSEKACCSDILAAYTYLTNQCDVRPSKIIIFGRSIGSGPAVYCAATRNVGGLVLIAPIASAVRVPLKRLNVTLPFIDTFPNIDRASKIQCPVLVVHGDMDELVPKIHAEKLFGKIRQHGHAVNPLWIPTARHNNIVEDFHSIVFSRYITFLDELRAMTADRRSFEDAVFKRISRGSRPPPYPSPTLTLPPPPPPSSTPTSVADEDDKPVEQQENPTLCTSPSLPAISRPPRRSSPRRSSRPRRSRRLPYVLCLRARVSLDNLSTKAKAGDGPMTPTPATVSTTSSDVATLSAPPQATPQLITSEEGASDEVVDMVHDDDHTRSATHTSSSSSAPDVGFSQTWRQLSLMQCIQPHASHHASSRPTAEHHHDQSWHSLSRTRLSFPLLRACLRRFEQDVERDVPANASSTVPITLQVNPSWQALRHSIESNGRVAPPA